jgi:hypothetical protein
VRGMNRARWLRANRRRGRMIALILSATELGHFARRRRPAAMETTNG